MDYNPAVRDQLRERRRDNYFDNQEISEYLKDRLPQLTREEERKYSRMVLEGTNQERLKAIEVLVNANRMLVVDVVRRVMSWTRALPVGDLLQEGTLGLLKAARIYDWRKGRFSTVAVWWIKQAINKALEKESGLVHLPSYAQKQLRAVYQAVEELKSERACQPTDREIAEKLKISEKRLQEISQFRIQISSIDQPFKPDGDEKVSEVFADESLISAERSVFLADLKEYVRTALSCLDDREREVIRRRFGFDGGIERNLGEIGESFGLSRERIRQIESRALAKLRSEFPKLADFI